MNWIEQLSIFNINDKWCDEAEQMMNPFLSLFGQFPYCKMLSRTSCHVCVSVMTVIWSSSSRFFSTVNEQSSSYLYSWGENEILLFRHSILFGLIRSCVNVESGYGNAKCRRKSTNQQWYRKCVARKLCKTKLSKYVMYVMPVTHTSQLFV